MVAVGGGVSKVVMTIILCTWVSWMSKAGGTGDASSVPPLLLKSYIQMYVLHVPNFVQSNWFALFFRSKKISSQLIVCSLFILSVIHLDVHENMF